MARQADRLQRQPVPPAGAALWAPLLDRKSAVPLSRQLAAALRKAVADGSFGAGSRLPSTRQLAAELGTARSTVVAVFEQLAAEGYIEARPGSGYFVPAPLGERRPAGPAPAAAARPLSRRAERLRGYAPHRPLVGRPFELGHAE